MKPFKSTNPVRSNPVSKCKLHICCADAFIATVNWKFLTVYPQTKNFKYL